MHEVSLARSIFNTIRSEVTADEYQRLSAVHLRVGRLANVEPLLMQNAFQAVTDSDYPEQAITLHIEVLPVLVHCQACDTTTEIESYTFVCSCGKPTANVVQGNELLISKIEFKDIVTQY
jgi:hydrogenase nickel incorporation protein HypA/HybF